MEEWLAVVVRVVQCQHYSRCWPLNPGGRGGGHHGGGGGGGSLSSGGGGGGGGGSEGGGGVFIAVLRRGCVHLQVLQDQLCFRLLRLAAFDLVDVVGLGEVVCRMETQQQQGVKSWETK